MEPVPLPKVDKKCLRCWRSRLNQYRSLVVFSWNALTFYHSSYLPGLAVWLGINLTVKVLFDMNLSLLQGIGQVLVIFAILYILLHFGSRFAEIELFPKWTPEFEDRFQHVCIHLAHAEERLLQKVGLAHQTRATNPWKFYFIWLVVGLVLVEMGKWISTALFVQFLTCFMLLLPVIMEYNLMSSSNQKMLKDALMEMYMHLKLKLHELSAARQRNR